MNVELTNWISGRFGGCRQTRRLIISDLPRSGTSWVAKALSFAPGFTYYREPDNHDHVKGAHLATTTQ